MLGSCIREIEEREIEKCAEVIRRSFATVAEEFNLTFANCPTHGTFMTLERLISERQNGALQYGLFINDNLIGFVCLKKSKSACNVYTLEKLAVLPESRHNGYGRVLLDFAKEKIRACGGEKIKIGIIEEHTVLKDWYHANGFVHIETKIFQHLPFTVGYMEYVIN